MARYDRHYDYGLRGAHQTGGPGYDRGMVGRGPRYDAGYGSFGGGAPSRFDPGYDERGLQRHGNRVTARYNLDYVYGARGIPDYDRQRNPYMYTGDRPDRMGDERWYRQPYMSRGGTRTLRGSSYPTGYDAPNYGPNYGGRYPDEMY